MTPARFPHSDTPGSTLGCQLPRAYRRLLRPSSALDAKASTTRPSQLVTHTTNPTPTPPQQTRTQGSGNETGNAHTTHNTQHKQQASHPTINDQQSGAGHVTATKNHNPPPANQTDG